MPETEGSQILLQWQSLDSYPHSRSTRWYSIGSLLVLGFAAYGLFDRSWSTALVALGIGLVYFLLRRTPLRIMNVKVNGLGISVDSFFTPWSGIRHFWILRKTDCIELHLLPRRYLQPMIMVFLRNPPSNLSPEDCDPAKAREVLLTFLPERTGMEERMLDVFARLLKL